MPNAKPKQPNDDVSDLEKKVDAMMAPNSPDVPEPEAKVTPSEAPKPAAVAGVPEVPKELRKGLDAFSTETPDITSETDTPKEPVKPKSTEPKKAEESKDPAPNDAIESPATDEAVTDIVREESDKLLQTDDEEAETEAAIKPKPSRRTWWRSKKFIYTVLSVLLIAIVALAVWPTSRYMLMNTAGIRSKASIKVIDESTKLPLNNVHVKIGAAEAVTNEKGVAAFDMVRLGKQPLVIERVAFAEINKDIVVGWGSNPLGEIELRATGARYEIKVTDFVSKKSVKAEATSGEAGAVSDKNGVIKLVVDGIDKQTVEISVQADGYRTEKLVVAANKKIATDVALVPSRPLVYVSKQSGKYDLYKVDVDGENKKVLLAGTGRENQDIKVALSPDGSKVAVVSTRGTKRDSTGTLLQTLTLVDVKTAESKTLDDASSITLIDWVESRLVYVSNYAGTLKESVQEQRLISYDTQESARTALATSTYFNAVASIGGYVYFAAVNDDPNQVTGYQKVRVDGTGKQTILSLRVLAAVRTDYANFSLETPEGWYAYKIGNDEATKGANPPDTYVSKQYIVSPTGSQSVWLDNRDGKGTVVLRNQATEKETALSATGGLAAPLRWLNSTTVAYRVSNLNETADYVKSTVSGEAHKVTNVTNTTGLVINF